MKSSVPVRWKVACVPVRLTKTWKYMKIVWVHVYQRKQHIIMLHLERYTSIHVSAAFEGLTSQLGQFMFISAPGVSLHFDLQTWEENARDTQEFNAVCGKHRPRFSTWSLKWKRPTVMQFKYTPNPSTKGLLQLTRLYLFDPVCCFTVNLEILTLGLTHAYVVWGGSWMQFVWCPKASKEEQIMTPIASAPNLSCCSNLYKLHHTSWNPQESTWNLTPKH